MSSRNYKEEIIKTEKAIAVLEENERLEREENERLEREEKERQRLKIEQLERQRLKIEQLERQRLKIEQLEKERQRLKIEIFIQMKDNMRFIESIYGNNAIYEIQLWLDKFVKGEVDDNKIREEVFVIFEKIKNKKL
jgi:hypothetical protein